MSFSDGRIDEFDKPEQIFIIQGFEIFVSSDWWRRDISYHGSSVWEYRANDLSLDPTGISSYSVFVTEEGAALELLRRLESEINSIHAKRNRLSERECDIRLRKIMHEEKYSHKFPSKF